MCFNIWSYACKYITIPNSRLLLWDKHIIRWFPLHCCIVTAEAAEIWAHQLSLKASMVSFHHLGSPLLTMYTKGDHAFHLTFLFDIIHSRKDSYSMLGLDSSTSNALMDLLSLPLRRNGLSLLLQSIFISWESSVGHHVYYLALGGLHYENPFVVRLVMMMEITIVVICWRPTHRRSLNQGNGNSLPHLRGFLLNKTALFPSLSTFTLLIVITISELAF